MDKTIFDRVILKLYASINVDEICIYTKKYKINDIIPKLSSNLVISSPPKQSKESITRYSF